MHQHRRGVPARHRPGLDPRRHPPARALPAGVLPAVVIRGAGPCAGAGLLVVRAGAAGPGTGGLADVVEQWAGGGQHAVLLEQLGDPGPGYAQLAADLGVGQALPGPGAGLPQPGRAEQRRAPIWWTSPLAPCSR